MIRRKRMFENVEDPCELLASLVDMGSVDIEDAFLACLAEMSAAECKRVLAKCGAGFVQSEEVDEFPADAEDGLEDADDFEDEGSEDDAEDVLDDEDESEDDEESEDSDDEAELESRLRRLEKTLRERCSKNEEDDEDTEDDMNERKSCRTESRIPVRRRFRR